MKKLPFLVASILLMGIGVANATEKITCLVKKELLLILEMKNQLRSQKEELSSTYLSMDNLILMLALMDEINLAKPNKRGNGIETIVNIAVTVINIIMV
jgi:hypothetical protein